MTTITRRRRTTDAPPSPTKQVRCAIYTRKSTEEGLQQDFNSLDAQREAGEAYVKAQTGEGWVLVPTRYDDGGYTGGNLDRPALQQLMTDIDAGKIDCVVVYKVDRLSRSLMDFSRVMDVFDKKRVSFVSVTQHFNTTNSMGRLTLNILLSFAQFEREIISERTRDKMAAARRKGKWSGGSPVLGYDVVDMRLVVNEAEAEQVRAIFQLYRDRRSLIEVAQNLDRRSWVTKRWITQGSKTRGGRPFNKNNLYGLLRNVVYVGRVAYQGEQYAGEHVGLVDPELFDEVQTLLAGHGQSGGRGPQVKTTGVLAGLVRCQACHCAMTHSTTARGTRRYRYYVCLQAQKRGYATCPAPTVPAGELEQFVVDQIRGIGRHPAMLAATVAELETQRRNAGQDGDREIEVLLGQIRDAYAELSQIAIDPHAIDRVADVQRQIDRHQRRLAELRQPDQRPADPEQVRQALADFDGVWDALTVKERNALLRLLIDKVEYDGAGGEIGLTFHPETAALLGQRTQE
jgi:site-specific DNA recombinase